MDRGSSPLERLASAMRGERVVIRVRLVEPERVGIGDVLVHRVDGRADLVRRHDDDRVERAQERSAPPGQRSERGDDSDRRGYRPLLLTGLSRCISGRPARSGASAGPTDFIASLVECADSAESSVYTS